MNEELTNEVLEEMKKCGLDCARCGSEFCNKYDWQDIVQTLATALLEERARPKVWDKAPEWADRADVSYKGNVKGKINISIYTRELPKTRTRIMAEEIASAHISNKDDLIDIIEQTINAHMEELKGEA